MQPEASLPGIRGIRKNAILRHFHIGFLPLHHSSPHHIIPYAAHTWFKGKIRNYSHSHFICFLPLRYVLKLFGDSGSGS